MVPAPGRVGVAHMPARSCGAALDYLDRLEFGDHPPQDLGGDRRAGRFVPIVEPDRRPQAPQSVRQ